MDNPCCTNMNTPKFSGTLDWSSGKFAFSNDSNNTVWYAAYYSDFSNVMLSILCGDPPKVYKSNFPCYFFLTSNTKTHKNNTEISQKPVHFLAQSQRQSPRLWTTTTPAIFPRGQLKLQSSFIQFWFYIFQFGHGFQQSSVQGHSFSTMFCFYEFHLMFH